MAPAGLATACALFAVGSATYGEPLWKRAWDTIVHALPQAEGRERQSWNGAGPWGWPAAEEKKPSVSEPSEETAAGEESKPDPPGGAGWGWSFTWAAGGFAEWFSTEDRPGRLQQDGGWLLYFIDNAGVKLFGLAWPLTACVSMFTFLAGLVGLCAYSIQVVTAPFRWACGVLACCCPRRRTQEERELDRLIPAPAVPASTVTWKGPGTGGATTTDFYANHIRGRGARRRPNDLLVRSAGQVARLRLDFSEKRKVDRRGLWVRYDEVKGASSRSFRRELSGKDQKWMHLCRASGCEEGDDHSKEYAAVDMDAIIDLGRHARMTPCRICVLFWRVWLWVMRLFVGALCGVCGCCCRRRGTKKVRTSPAAALFDEESESEAEEEESPCQAIKVGIACEGATRALAPDGCDEAAPGGGTALIVEDAKVSDFPPCVEVEP